MPKAKHSGRPMGKKNVYFDLGQWEKLDKIKQAQGISISELIRIAIDQYLMRKNDE